MGKLVCIEVENFKSYKGKQTIGPFNEFTSVIGPNGSGKSNLMDAISFVLGVHSSHLRSQNLKDMIYRSEALREGATSGRAARTAHVTAVYQPSEGAELKFMRSINNSGQSEYRINGQLMQYSQYNAALEKENILVKAKNFLVFQGDVESVASQNPKELTRLIEQISGSWEYRDQYDKLKQKMEEETENSAYAFNKKRGAAAEIKQYEDQKKEAEEFEKLVADRRDFIVQYLLWKLYHIDQKQEALSEEQYKKNIEKGELQYEAESMEEAFRKLREEKARIHREKIRCELNIRKINRELDEQTPTAIGYKEKIIQLEKKSRQTEHNIERVKRDGKQQQQLVTSLDQNLQLLNEAERSYNESIPASDLTRGPVLTEAQLMDYERRKQEVSIKAVDEQHQLQQLDRNHRTEKQRVDDKKYKLDQLKDSETENLNLLRETEEQKAQLELEAESINESLVVRRAELQQLETERTTTHNREVQLNEELQVVLNKLMEASVTKFENDKEDKFNNSIAVMKQIFPNVHGKLADLCRPTQRKYDTAVATVLGRNMDAIVVEDEHTAFECIQYMREQHIGLATFLPLNSLSLPPINDRYRNFVKGARLAYDVLKFDKQYNNAIQYACGSTLVCDNMNIAKQICFELNESVRAVSLDGAVIHQSGLMTGGQSSVQSTQKWQAVEVDELTRKRDKLLAELNVLSKNKRMGSAEDLAKMDCSNMQSQLNTLNEEIITLTRRIEGIHGTIQDIRGKIAEATPIYEQSKLALDQMQANMKNIQAQIAQIEDHVFEDFCAHINVINIREFEAMRYGVSDEVIEQRAQFATQRRRLETQLNFERVQLNDLVERLKKLEITLVNDTKSKAQYEADLAGMSGKTETLRGRLQEFENDLAREVRLEDDKQQEISELTRALEAKGKDVEAILREFRTVETQYEKLRAERISIFRKCKLEGIDLPLKNGTMNDIIIEESSTATAAAAAAAAVNGDMSDASSVTDSLSVADSASFTDTSSDMDLDAPSQTSIRSTDWVVEVDFDQLGEYQKENGGASTDRKFQDRIKEMGNQIEQMAPNLKAIDRLEGVAERLKIAEAEFNTARAAAKLAREQFAAVKKMRHSLFYAAYSHISEKIDLVYKDLTKSNTHTLGGNAYLTAEDDDEGYLAGITYHALPPMKRFRDMEQLSGGEKSVAALALLFAIHSYKPSPFFVLDEVDAALDNANVATVASYLREHASPEFQFIVISLKHTLYERAQSLVGIYRDQDVNSSKTMTLMLDQYQI